MSGQVQAPAYGPTRFEVLQGGSGLCPYALAGTDIGLLAYGAGADVLYAAAATATPRRRPRGRDRREEHARDEPRAARRV
eukprot:3052459-Rhodomonas_salina.4